MDIVPIGVTFTRQNTHLCCICHNPQKKNGKRNGKQRWRCTNCNASTTYRRADLTARNQLSGFVAWINSKFTQAEPAGGTGRTFRHQTQWCWRITPSLPATGKIFTEIQVDGIYLKHSGWRLLIAIGNGKVIVWQWCNTENTAAWNQLLHRIPEPQIPITDRGSVLLKALTGLDPEVMIQRCLVHLQRTVK